MLGEVMPWFRSSMRGARELCRQAMKTFMNRYTTKVFELHYQPEHQSRASLPKKLNIFTASISGYLSIAEDNLHCGISTCIHAAREAPPRQVTRSWIPRKRSYIPHPPHRSRCPTSRTTNDMTYASPRK